MLVLTRKHNETLSIGNDIVITIVRVQGDSVRIGIQAPKDIRIMRSELIGTPQEATIASPKTSKPAANEKRDSKKAEQAPLAGFLKVASKVELATAS